MVPTVLDALDITPPEQIRGVAQSPIEGVSFAHTFNDANAPTEHHTQYFEMFATRAIDHDGWRAVCGFPGPSYAEVPKKGEPLVMKSPLNFWMIWTPMAGNCTTLPRPR